MIHWAWLIFAFVAGLMLGNLGKVSQKEGFALGVIGTLLALIGL